MAFQVSPGVNVSEIDLTTVVPAVSSTEGAIAGVFRWGPVEERVLVSSENELVARFGKPTSDNFETFFAAANFLSYGNKLYVSRAGDNFAFNAYSTASGARLTQTSVLSGVVIANTSGGFTCTSTSLEVGDTITVTGAITDNGSLDGSITDYTSGPTTYKVSAVSGTVGAVTGFTLTTTSDVALTTTAGVTVGATFTATIAENTLIENKADYDTTYSSLDTAALYWARYAGVLGNSLKVSVCDSATAYSSVLFSGTNFANLGATFTAVPGSTSVAVANVVNSALDSLNLGDLIEIDSRLLKVTAKSALTSTSELTLGTVAITNSSGAFSCDSAALTAGMIVTITGTFGGTGSILGYTSGKRYKISVESDTAFTLVNLDGTAIVTTDGTPSGLTFKAQAPTTATLTVDNAFTGIDTTTVTGTTRYWEFYNDFNVAPGTSESVAAAGGASDELHIVVVDEDGLFTGEAGTIIEKYQSVSRASDAKGPEGGTIYYRDLINNNSQYIYVGAAREAGYDEVAATSAAVTATTPLTLSFRGGADSAAEGSVTLASLSAAWDLFKNAEEVDVSLLVAGKAVGLNGVQLANYLIDNIAEYRRDCVVFISPRATDVVNQVNAAENAVAFRNNLRSTSYAVLDSGYKYQYDRYNDVNRYIPLNGDIAGLCVRTDETRDPWFSPAGFNRGQVKNILKLAYNPDKAKRDLLYKAGVNPVVSFPGQGTVLYGDKTLLAKPSAFDRINVRRLFIVLEKAIATSAKFSLFEFNDEFTRAQFRSLVEPYLRDVLGRRGIYDFRVICDSTNNSAEVVDRNEFVGDIYIKPARSINFIQLNFVAVRTGVEFSEVVGQF
jgi:phage tail sheath protein FI